LQPSSTGKNNDFRIPSAHTPAKAVTHAQKSVSHAVMGTPAVIPIETTPIPIDPMFDTWQAAEVLGVSHDRVKKWRYYGQGPQFVRYPDGGIRYRLSAIKKFLDDHAVDPRPLLWAEVS
jgi:hypothetical protein